MHYFSEHLKLLLGMILMYGITTSMREIKRFRIVVYQNSRSILNIKELLWIGSQKELGIWFQILQKTTVCYLISALRIMHQSPAIWHVRCYLHKWAAWPHGLMIHKFWTTIKHKKIQLHIIKNTTQNYKKILL